MIVNAASLAALETSLKGEFNKGQASVQAQWSKVATEVKSTRSGNTYAWAKGWPKLREWIGDRVIHRPVSYTHLDVYKRQPDHRADPAPGEGRHQLRGVPGRTG